MFKSLETYPVEYAKAHRRYVFWLAVVMLLCIAATLFFSVNGLALLPAIIGAVFLLLTLHFVMAFVSPGEVAFRPYYDRKMEMSTYLAFEDGKNLARNSRPLDALARACGATPLSAFGFADDLADETVVWHDPTVGIATIDRLIQIIAADDERPARNLHSVEAVKQSLYALRSQLEVAASGNARFALLIRPNAISGLEVERRKGYF